MASEARGYEPGPQRAATRLALAIGAFATGTDATMIAGVLPRIARSFGTTPSRAGLLVTAFAGAYALAAPVVAALTDRLSLRAVMTGSLLLFAAGNLGGALAPDLGTLFAIRVLTAVAASGFVPAAASSAAAAARSRPGRALAAVLSGSAAAAVIGVPAGAALAAWTSWRVAFVMVAALGVLAAGIVSRAELPPRRQSASTRAHLNAHAVRLLAVTVAAFTGEFALYQYLGLVTDPHGPGLAVVLLCFGGAGLAGAWIGGALTDRLGGRVAARAALVTMLATAATASLWHGAGALELVGVAALGITAFGITTPQQARLLATGGHETVLLGAGQTALYLGLALAGVMGSASIARGRWALSLASAVAIATGLLVSEGGNG